VNNLSEEFMKHILQNSLIYHVFTDRDLNIIEVSGNFLDIIEYTQVELLKMKFTQLIPNDHFDVPSSNFETSLIDKKQYKERMKLESKSGKILYTYLLAQLQNQRIVISLYMSKYSYGMFDIQYSDNIWNVLHELLLSSPTPIFAKLKDGTHILTNNADIRYLGKTLDEVIGKKNHEIFDPDVAEMISKIDEEILRHEKTITREETITYEGEEYTFLTTRGVFRSVDGEVQGIYGIAQDITLQKKFEKNMLISQKFDSLGKLISGISHDFNNLLAGIMGYASILEHDLVGKNQEHAKLIKRSTIRARNLIKELLEYSKDSTIRKQNFSINKVVIETLELIGVDKSGPIKLILNLEEDLQLFYGDESQMMQIIMNLALNSIDAMNNSGVLTIISRSINLDNDEKYGVKSGKYLEIVVSDTGNGIAPEISNQIFDPFFTTKSDTNSYGLGLTTVYSIVKNHNGIIIPTSEVGKGTNMKILLPYLEGNEVKPGPISVIINNVLINKQTFNILFIDDNEILGDAIIQLVSEFNHRVFYKNNGSEGIEYYRNNKDNIDFVLVDMIMKNLNGIDVLQEIKKINPNAIVVLTSGFHDSKKDEFFKLGGFDFIAKPFTIDEFNILLNKIQTKILEIN
jgi:PAS domain S-box-containing protein